MNGSHLMAIYVCVLFDNYDGLFMKIVKKQIETSRVFTESWNYLRHSQQNYVINSSLLIFNLCNKVWII